MKFKPRLRRLDWLYTDNPIYYLTLCTENRMRTLANPDIHQEFTKIFGACDQLLRAGWVLHDHARPHPFVRRFLSQIAAVVEVGESIEGQLVQATPGEERRGNALGKRLFRSCTEIPRIVCGENGICASKSCPSRPGETPGGLALSGGDPPPRFSFEAVAAISDRRASVGDRRYSMLQLRAGARPSWPAMRWESLAMVCREAPLRYTEQALRLLLTSGFRLAPRSFSLCQWPDGRDNLTSTRGEIGGGGEDS